MFLEISSFLTEISSFLPKNLPKNNAFSPQNPSNLLIFEFSSPVGTLEGSAFAIVNFSVRHRSHFLVEPLQGRALEAIFQLIWCWIVFPFSSQMCLESSVLFCLLLFLIVEV